MNLRLGCPILFLALAAACTPDASVSPVELTNANLMSDNTPSPALAPCPACVFGPQIFTRSVGNPKTEKADFPGDPAADYIIDIDDGGSQASAIVVLNGVQIYPTWQPGPEVGGAGHLRVEAKLRERNKLQVRLMGVPGSALIVSVIGGAKVIGSNGGSVTAPGSHARLSFDPGAISGQLGVGIQSVASLVPEHQPLSSSAFKVAFDVSQVVAVGSGEVRIELPLSTLPSPTASGAFRAVLEGSTISLWRTAVIAPSTQSAEISGTLADLLGSFQSVGTQLAMTLAVEAYEVPTIDEVAPNARTGEQSLFPSLQASASGKRCYLDSANSWKSVYGMVLGDISAVSLWQRAGGPSLQGGPTVFVLVPGWQRSITDCDEYRYVAERANSYFASLIGIIGNSQNGVQSFPLIVADYPTFNDFRYSGQELANALTKLQQQYGVRVVLVGHSMGGLVAREAADLMTTKPVGIVTLGTPHLGSPLASLAFWQVAPATPGHTSLVQGLQARQSSTTEAPLRAFGSDVTFRITNLCIPTFLSVCVIVNNGVPPFWDDPLYGNLGGLLCRVFVCHSDGVVPFYSSIPSWLASADGRKYTGFDHETLKGGYGANLDAALMADLRSFLPPPPPPAGGWCNAFLDFTGNSLPSGWTQFVVRGGPGLTNNRLEALPTDGGARIGPSVTPMPMSKITLEYDALSNQSISGTHHGLNLTAGATSLIIEEANASFNFGAGNLGFRVLTGSGIWPNSNTTSTSLDIRPFDPGQQRVSLEVTATTASWVVENTQTGRVVSSTLPMPAGFSLSSVDGFYVFAYETTGAGTWIDNLRVSCQ